MKGIMIIAFSSKGKKGGSPSPQMARGMVVHYAFALLMRRRILDERDNDFAVFFYSYDCPFV